MQNKANFKMGNINISTARTKAYANKQRTMSNEHYSKQTQSNPISNAETPCPAYPICPVCHARDCHPFDCAPARIACNDEGEDKAVYDWGVGVYNWADSTLLSTDVMMLDTYGRLQHY